MVNPFTPMAPETARKKPYCFIFIYFCETTKTNVTSKQPVGK